MGSAMWSFSQERFAYPPDSLPRIDSNSWSDSPGAPSPPSGPPLRQDTTTASKPPQRKTIASDFLVFMLTPFRDHSRPPRADSTPFGIAKQPLPGRLVHASP